MLTNKTHRNQFFETLVQRTIRTILKEPASLVKMYEGYKAIIENEIKTNSKTEQEYYELLQILEKAYEIFSDPNIQNMIEKNCISPEQFILKYQEKILGDEKRKYNMSELANSDLIASDSGVKCVKYFQAEGVKHTYLDVEGKEISIQEIGRLAFKLWNGIDSMIFKYRIIRQINGNTCQEEIFSNIRVAMMDEPEYREAVLEELLSKNNIQLSKAGGYVGNIEEASKEEELEIRKEKLLQNGYFYRVNKKYMLVYHSEEISAAVIQIDRENSNNSKNTKQMQDDGESR